MASVLRSYLIGDRGAPIGIIGDQHGSSHTLGNWLNPRGSASGYLRRRAHQWLRPAQ